MPEVLLDYSTRQFLVFWLERVFVNLVWPVLVTCDNDNYEKFKEVISV